MKRALVPLMVILLGVWAWLMLPRAPHTAEVAQTPTSGRSIEPPRWETVDPSVERFEDGTVILYRMPLGAIGLRFEHSSSAPKTVGAWADEIPDELAVINGVYFNEDYAPTGFLVTDGKTVSTRRFDPKRSGFLILASTFEIRERLDLKGVVEAAQSYPYLIKNKKSAVSTDSGLMARRSFIGSDEQDRLYLGVAAARPISLYELGRHLAGLDVQWKSVLNLDGGPSTGLSITIEKHRFDLPSVPVPNVIVVTRTNQ